MTILKNKILEIRVDSNLSRERFAKSLGYSKSYVADIETGRTKPSRRFLEKISSVRGVSIDWLLSESTILDLIEANKITEDPDLIFTYAFTQKGIDRAEKYLKELLANKKFIFIDASGIKSLYQFLKKLINTDGNSGQLWYKLEDIMLNQEVVLIIKNISLSKIYRSGYFIKDIFKIMDDAWEVNKSGDDVELEHRMPPSTLIILDFPSYLEKNMDTFGYYAVPIYMGTPYHYYK